MGMFDNVRHKANCPECGSEMTGWQTKDREQPMLETLDPLDCVCFYDSCRNEECGAFVTMFRKRAKSIDDFDMIVETRAQRRNLARQWERGR